MLETREVIRAWDLAIIRRTRGKSTRFEAVPIGPREVPDTGDRIDQIDGHSGDLFFSIESNSGEAAVDGNTSRLEAEHESQASPVAGDGNPLGTRAQPATTFSESEGVSTPIDSEKVIERFKENTALRFKPGSETAEKYAEQWLRFVKRTRLEEFTPNQLKAKDRDGPEWQTVGGRLLLRYMREGIPDARKPATRNVILASLKTVWIYGLGIPWPLDVRRDFGRTLRGNGARITPKDGEIEPFFRATESENDPYLRSMMAVQLSCGLRSANHLGNLTWRAIQWEGAKPYAIVAAGQECGFKTDALLAAYLPPFASEALAAWKAQTPTDLPEDAPIWPMRPCEGTVKDFLKPHDRKTLVNLFTRWKVRHRIESRLTLMFFRHWVKRKAEQAGLDPSTADYLQGHQPKTDGGLSYGKVRDWETVVDEQRSKWPDGPLGFAFGPKVQVLDEDAPYLRLIADLKAGRLSELEFAMAVAKVKANSQVPPLEP